MYAPDTIAALSTAPGTGAIAVVRILFHISLAKMLTVFYILLFLLSFFTPSDFVAVAFDNCFDHGFLGGGRSGVGRTGAGCAAHENNINRLNTTGCVYVDYKHNI